jgi:glycosyltransferase involved in cell wall biosynthesis
MSSIPHLVRRVGAAGPLSRPIARLRRVWRADERLRIGLVGGPRFGIEEPFAGGMEAMLRSLAVGLARRGHEVEVFAGTATSSSAGSGFRCEPLVARTFTPSVAARADVSMPPDRFMEEHHAFMVLGRRLAEGHHDVIHNHSLHYLPPLFDTPAPILHTLHSPPTPWLESAHSQLRRRRDRVVSVSWANARTWGFVRDVVHNGVELPVVDPRDVGDHVVWTGRIVPEKGTHLAIDAARSVGRPIVVAGPIHDRPYFDAEVAPRLGDDVRYAGHLDRRQVAELVAGAAVAVATPCWEEPFGLVVIEALAVGTPVAAFARGGVPELLTAEVGRLAAPGDVAALGRALDDAATLDRGACRRHVERHFSIESMVDRYEAIYRDMAGGRLRRLAS